ncbi:hypothetical protein DPEC_G00353210 [Dallia pectoralis]|uniref:Uncharacterized protein n=1 Tax=Dallia pectoralis TaxID=75939 RepID=A0ACC2F2G8_DALPE|nr:hypothetical protein DPEC_G00353210 [Dallia pectoralis]
MLRSIGLSGNKRYICQAQATSGQRNAHPVANGYQSPSNGSLLQLKVETVVIEQRVIDCFSTTAMAFEQRVRVGQSTQLLPNVVSTEQQSVIVVKKLLAIAVSSITYLRGLFPEKAYGSKYVEEQKVMILKEERTCPGATQIVQWMQGCFDALQRKYLRTVVLSIYTDSENPKNVTECYQFKVQYTEIGPTVDFESKNSQNVSRLACTNTKKASILLVRKLYTLMQNLGPLPDNVCLNMKLSYYDDVTPQDYQPPGFKEGDNDSMQFEKEPVYLTMGEVVTPFHTLKVDVTTERERLEQIDDERPVCVRDKWEMKIEEDGAVTRVSSQQERKAEVNSVSKKPFIIEETITSQFEFPCSQDVPSTLPKRRKFSEPKECY